MNKKAVYCLIATAFLANNIAWYWVMENHQTAPVETSQSNMQISTPYSARPSAQNTATTELAANSKVASKPATIKTPFQSKTRDVGVRMEDSLDFVAEHRMDSEQFFQNSTQKKLSTIENLSAQGDDLKLLDKIVHTDHNNQVRLAALQRLGGQQSYGATHLLIDALDDSNSDVALTALNTLTANGDRTLLPLLQAKMQKLPSGTIRDQFSRALDRLDLSVSTEGDNFASQ